jgi:type VI secretion system protein ImpG
MGTVKDQSDQVYLDFLGELSGFDRFRQRFQERNPGLPLEREDPDVRRLMEAMAYFSVRTRQAMTRNLRSTWRRLFASFFDYLLEPVPAATMIQAVPTEKMAEATVLTRGTEVRLTSSEAEAGTGHFRLQRDLRVLPIFLEQSEVLQRQAGGWRLVLGFRSQGLRKDPVDVLSLYVRHLDAYRSSLSVFHALRTSLEQVTVLYNASAGADAPGEECEVSFAPFPETPPTPEDSGLYVNPLQRVRSFFQFPEQQLFVNVKVPPHRKDWDRFSLCFDFHQDWRLGRSRYPEFLVPFVVPAVNLKKEPAQVITLDGTRSEYPIRGLGSARDFSLHSVTGVYELTKAGPAAMRPSFLPGEGPSYEIEETFDESLRSYQSLVVRMPEAFTSPRKVLVEALWYQPRFAPQGTGRIGVMLPGRHIAGLQLQTLGEVHPHSESPLGDDVDKLTQILAWKTKPTLKLDELVALLSYLGTPADSPLRQVIPLLRGLKVTTVPDGALRGSGIQHAYEVQLQEFDPSLDPLVVCFLDQVRELLDVWNGEATVALKAFVDGRGELSLTMPP